MINMKNLSMLSLVMVIALAVSELLPGASATQAQVSLPEVRERTCVTDWGKAGEIVSKNGFVTVEELARTSNKRFGGSIIKAALCEGEAGYFYRLVVKRPTGRLISTVVSAKER